ncbi:MAG: hypothetical protein ACI9KE_000194 [Polyangiales bacterium]|jgi:hypothetical protein
MLARSNTLLVLLLCACGGAQTATTLPAPEADSAETETVEVAPPPPPLRNAQGPGWTLRDGVFESAVSGIRVRDSESWHFSRDPALTPRAVDFALRHTSGVTFSAHGFDTYEEVSREILGAFHPALDEALGPGGGQVVLDAGEDAIRLLQHERAGSGVYAGIHVVGTRMLYFQITYPASALPDLNDIIASLPAVEVLRGEELAEVIDEARQVTTPRVSLQASLRDNQFQDFESGIRLSLYPGVWQTALGQGALITATERLDNVTFTLGHTRAADVSAAVAHEALRAQVFGETEVAPAQSVSFGSEGALVSEAVIEGVTPELRRAISIIRNDEVIWWQVAAPRAAFEAARERIVALEASLRFDDASDTTSVEATKITDRRFGVELPVPAGYTPTPIAAPTHSAYLLQEGSNELALFLLPRTADAAAHLARLRERTRADLGEPESESDSELRWVNGERFLVREMNGCFLVAVQLFPGDSAEAVVTGARALSSAP